MSRILLLGRTVMGECEHLRQGEMGAEEGSRAASRPFCRGGCARPALVGMDLELSTLSRWGAGLVSEAVDKVTSCLLPERI